jgi:hypothetical protein
MSFKDSMLWQRYINKLHILRELEGDEETVRGVQRGEWSEGEDGGLAGIDWSVLFSSRRDMNHRQRPDDIGKQSLCFGLG